MERPTTLQLPTTERPAVDYRLASQCIKPLAGRFYAVEPPPLEKVGAIYLPDATGASLQSDACVVIAVGAGVDLAAGDTVLVRPTHGTWIEDGVWGEYRAEGRVRIYGIACEFQGEPKEVTWDECAPVKESENDGYMIGRFKKNGKPFMLEATGRNVILKRDPVIRSERGLLLPDDAVYRSCMARVVSVGSQVREVRVGDRVHYNPIALLDFMFGDDPDLAVCTEEAIHAVIEEAA